MKKALSILLILALVCIPLAACSEDIETVELTLWGGEFDQDMLRIMADAFIEANADQANITINLGVESESSAKDTILVDPQAAADVFATVDDQLMELYNAGALQEVSENVAAIKSANFDIAIDAATINGKL
ncbi:MAG: maltose ABC transporter substrate-binding protein, partial [Oscillospiraceae bacterium]|nr:maltose ABC transporter substrate-binding protein [Oscillospiraceae bacterium]